MHALTEMTRQLRSSKKAKKAATGLILANGGVLTYQHAVCLSSHPRKDNSAYPSANPLPAGPPRLQDAPRVQAEAEGVGIIEVRCNSIHPTVVVASADLLITRPTPSTTRATARPCGATSWAAWLRMSTASSRTMRMRRLCLRSAA